MADYDDLLTAYKKDYSQEKQDVVRSYKDKYAEYNSALTVDARKAACIEMFKVLSTSEGRRFVMHHDKFARSVSAKLKEFYYEDGYKEFGKYYRYIFRIDI